MQESQAHFAASRCLLACALLAALQLGFAADAPPAAETISADGNAAKTLDRSYSFAGDGTIEVSNVRGSVTVTGGNQDRVTLTGSLGAGSKLTIEGSARHLDLHVESASSGGFFGGHGPGSDSTLVLIVPHASAVKLDLVSADGKVSGVDGKSLEVDCVSGKLVLSSAATSVDVDSVSGDVSFEAARTGATEHVHLQTVSGNIDAKGVGGRVKLETVSGRIGFASPEVSEFNAESVSGAIEATTGLAKSGRMHVETLSGSLRAHLPANLSARIHGQTFSGSLRSDFGTVSKAEFGPGSDLDVRVGDGDARIEAQSFSGNVELRKQ
ncbi:MAG TPA: DUF4097 family beta strand repeat-containing protein [Rudaea sp.]|jgi:hypothetical protein|uniref:DUF4097 family beta strand repeat-containing protein n=1 Tax=Rudaea sp. TaxID=2136325 RepID=UPI002F925465